MAQSWLTEKWWWLCLSSSYQSTLHRFFKISCPKRTPPGHRLHFFFKWFKQRKPTREFFQLIWARLFGCMSLHQRRWTLINFFLVDLIDGNGCFSNPAISYGKSAILAPNSRFLLFLRKTIYGSHINDIIYHSPLTVSFLGSSFLLDRSPTMTDDRTSKSVISVFSQIHLL